MRATLVGKVCAGFQKVHRNRMHRVQTHIDERSVSSDNKAGE